jgi:hypothetical protein
MAEAPDPYAPKVVSLDKARGPANGHANGRSVPPPPDKPDIKRSGLGYVGDFPGNVTIRATRFRESSDGVSCEMTITCPQVKGGILEWGRINLVAGQTRASLAKRLSERVEGDWRATLELFCHQVVQMEREGTQVEATDPEADDVPLRFLLHPLLPLGLSTLLYGAGGTGKSTVAAAIALSVQTGEEVVKGWNPDEQAEVILYDWEADKERWQQRVNAVARASGIKPSKIAYRKMRRRLFEDMDAVAKNIEEYGFGLIIVDSVNRAFGVSHRESDPAENAIEAFDMMAEHPVTWLLIDHITGDETKTGSIPLKAYGSIAKQWAVRQQFCLKREPDPMPGRIELVLHHTKTNYAEMMTPQGLYIAHGDRGIQVQLTDQLSSPELVDSLSMPQRVLRALKSGARSLEGLREQLGIDVKNKSDRDKLAVSVSRLIKRGELTRLQSGLLALPAPQTEASFGAG